MKKLFLFFLLVALCITGLWSEPVLAQSDSFDVVTLLNGKEMKGKVTGITDDDITFVYQGETLSYTVKKEEINKIQFASGRIEEINPELETSANAAAAVDVPVIQPDLVAVLPFAYIGEGGSKDEKLSKKVQADCYNLLLKLAPQYAIQDPMKTNALLARNGINESNVEGLLPDELCQILGAGYVVIGSILVDYKGTTNYGSSNTESKKSADNKKMSTYTSSSSSATEQFETQVDLKVYTSGGQNISSQSRRSFWQTEDAYQITLQYLLKRTPFYSK